MPSRKVVFFDDLSEEELAQSGAVMSTFAKVSKIATVPKAFVIRPSVFKEFVSQVGDLSERLLSWDVELEIARAFDNLGSSVVHVVPSPSYASEISDSYVSGKASLVTEIRKTMAEFLSEEEEDYRKGEEVEDFQLAFMVQEIPPLLASGSIEKGPGEGLFFVKALLGLPVDLSASDKMTIDIEGSVVDKRVFSQEKKWITDEAGIEEVNVEKELKRELKIPKELLKKLSRVGDRLTTKMGMGTYFWYLKDRIFIVWNVTLLKEEPKEEVVPVEREIPPMEMSIFLQTKVPPESVDKAEIQGLFLIPAEDVQLDMDGLLELSDQLKPMPIVISADEKGMESVAKARKEGAVNVWPLFEVTGPEFQEITKPATESGLEKSEELPFWAIVNSPMTLLLVKEMAEVFDGIFIPLEEMMSRMEDSPEDKRFELALSAISVIIEDVHEQGLVMAIGTSVPDRLTDIWNYCLDKGIDILALGNHLIKDIPSLRQAKEA
jgi:hypothetical protein